MYAEQHTIWSGQPNAQLVAETSRLAPGTALDVGCGEGADAVWLAEHGWDVTAVDISAIALDRARAHASSAGVNISFEVPISSTTPPAPPARTTWCRPSSSTSPTRHASRLTAASAQPSGQAATCWSSATTPSEHIGNDHPERLFTTGEIVALFDGRLARRDVGDPRA